MSKTFLIADTHFGDEQIIAYEDRPFQNADTMNQSIIKNWNITVSNDDQVFILGDFSIKNKNLAKDILQQLNGYKTLILGNHDKWIPAKTWLDLGFNEVIGYPILYEGFYILSHEPLYISRQMPYGNVFGHIHNHPAYKDVSQQTFCVSAERLHYTPIDWNVILLRMKLVEEF